MSQSCDLNIESDYKNWINVSIQKQYVEVFHYFLSFYKAKDMLI